MIASTGLLRDLKVAGRRRKFLDWTVLGFVVVVGVAYSPGVLTVFNILGDFDALALKREHFLFHNEAVHLASVARPVAASAQQPAGAIC